MAGWRRAGQRAVRSPRTPAPGTAAPLTTMPFRRWRDRKRFFDDPDRVGRLFQILFFVFLAFVMVRISSGDADSDEARLIRQAGVASGDQTKQIIYFVFSVVFVGLWIRLRGAMVPRCLSIFQLLLFAWILASVGWALDPMVSLRRVVLLFTVVTGLAICLDILGPDRSLKTLYWVLAVCIVLSLICVPFFKFAVHQPTEVDQSIVGGWRGIFIHKNTAGAVCAAALVIFFHTAVNERKWHQWVLVGVSLLFLWGTKSKTPVILFPMAIGMGFLYRYLYGRFGGRFWFGFLTIVTLSIVIFVAIVYAAAITRIFADTESFTGRAGLWQAVLGFVKDHPWLGAGYSSLWGINADPPILPYVTAPEQQFMVHSHNGYLELLANLGIPGLALALMAAVCYPLFQILKERDPRNLVLNANVFSVFVFCMSENLLETQLYTRDREIWVIYLVMILGLQLRYLERRRSVYQRNDPGGASEVPHSWAGSSDVRHSAVTLGGGL